MASAAAGGGATYLKGLLPALAAMDVRSSLLTGTDGDLAAMAQTLGFDVYPIDLMASRFGLLKARALLSKIQELSPVAVHAHGTRAAFYCGLANVSASFPVFYTAHGIAFREGQNPMKRFVMAGAEWLSLQGLSGLASVSRDDLARLRSLPGKKVEPAIYIPNPVDTTAYRPGDKTSARKRLGIPVDVPVVGTVSRLVEQKAVHVLLEAASTAKGTHVVIVGDGPLESSLKKQASALGLECHFLGSRNDIPAILPAFDLFVLSSAWEGEPLSLLEAMACGLPCIATDTPGASDILLQGKAGRIVRRGSAAELGTAICEFLQDPAVRQEAGEQALLAATERTMEETARKTLSLYRSGLGLA